SVDERESIEHDGDLARAQARRLLRESVLHADSSDLHSAKRRVSIEADADVGVAAQRRTHLGSEDERRHATAATDSGARARLLPRAKVSELRQSRAARYCVESGERSVR